MIIEMKAKATNTPIRTSLVILDSSSESSPSAMSTSEFFD